MRRIQLAAALVVSCLAAPLSAHAQAPDAPTQTAAPAAEQPAIAQSEAAQGADAEAFYDSLDRRNGAILLAGGKVQLSVPQTHYFIGPDDARRVIVELWGNPPAAAQGVEGMIFPAGANPAAGAWGAVVEYASDGHVKDDDAASIKYDELLRDMQTATREQNAERREQGFDEITLEGWAEQPHYDEAAHTLYWAKLLSSSAGFSSLNYDIRVLGREGVLVISFVADPAELETIRASAPTVTAMPAFTEGNRYGDYREGVDKAAAYGIGGLIAGGVAVAAVKKLGLLAVLMAFGKKAIGLVIVGGVALAALLKRLFARKDSLQAAEPPT
jgi:uncharacterized membrane-anchored protein